MSTTLRCPCGRELTDGEVEMGATQCGECVVLDGEVQEKVQSDQKSANVWGDIILDEGDDLEGQADVFSATPKRYSTDVYGRFHPSLKIVCHTYEKKIGTEDRESELYVMNSKVVNIPAVQLHAKKTTFVPCVDTFMNYHLWPIRYGRSGQLDNRLASLFKAVRQGRNEWVMVLWNSKQSVYDTKPSEGDLGDPAWPDLDELGWLKAAFPEDRVVNSSDHEIVKQLRGLER